ncbi:MAG: VTT domain-containing protein [Pseudomonadota bacterium]
MVRLFEALWRFVTTMDAKAATSVFVTLVLLIFLILMFLFGRDVLGLEPGAVENLMATVAESPLAVIGVIAIYVLLALTGFPQFLLIGATVYAFGHIQGAFYAWIATMVSATFTFTLGYVFGGRFIKRMDTGRLVALSQFLGRHGIFASGVVRVVPSAPFIVVNMAAGASHISIFKFWIGTGIGIIPKIIAVALVGGSMFEFLASRDPRDLVIVAVIVPVWVAFLILVRRLYVKMRAADND